MSTSMSRRVWPLISLDVGSGNWIIKVQVTNKGNLRSYQNLRGDGRVFSVELADQDGTPIQATMFNKAAEKFHPVFEVGKVYYISKGSVRVANQQYKTVPNDYEITLNEKSVVVEAHGETFTAQVKYNFVKIDQLEQYVKTRILVDIVGVVQSVSTTMSIKRKSDNEIIPKREIVVLDDSGKTVSVSLWSDLATISGQELLEIVDSSPVVAIKSLRVTDFQGVSLSTISRSTVVIDPDFPEANVLKSWYNSEGKGNPITPIGTNMVATDVAQTKSMYTDRVFLSDITSCPNLGHDKPASLTFNAMVCNIKPDQNMWYRACKKCNKKVTETPASGYWCDGCNKMLDDFSLRYILVIKVSDPTGDAWITLFNEQAEKIIGCTAQELDRIKKEEGEDMYFRKLQQATWGAFQFRVNVTQHKYNGATRQRIIAKIVAPVDHAAEAKFLLEQIENMNL